ncbi:cupredoxin domain-containing protein [Sphingomonas radiodurans]|uniref:cupredoxin domain-containing protein n=1 Tax=Sphingomonas radiodurans TaxID=2890321 RepID=UPI001E5F57D7|nr:methylamine utilization protein [Sphingomonas radiodurans]WBH15747.1 methylamine utilization protein [Sphingomonas radiodurans]
MKIAIVLAATCLAAPLPALAGTVTVRIVDAAGAAVPDAVVTIHPAAGAPAGPLRFPWANAMVQRNIAFNPGTLIVPVGATVSFPNQDKVRHHVYSFSKPAKFELKLFGKDESRSYTFKTLGAVALGCNIHDTMSGFIKVVDTPFADKTGSAGDARIAGVTAGRSQLTIWHPRLRSKLNEMSFPLDVPATGDVAKRITIILR